MSQIVYNKETGEYARWSPSTGLVPITEGEVEQEGKTRPERVLGSAGDTLQDSAGAALEATSGGNRGSDIVTRALGPLLNPAGYLLGAAGLNPAADLGQSIQQSNDQRQADRYAVDPAMSNVGTALGIGAELAVPGPKIAGAGRFGRVMSAGERRGVEMADTMRSEGGRLGRWKDFVEPKIDTIKNIPNSYGIVDSNATRTGRSLSAAARSADDVAYEGGERLFRVDVPGAVDRGMPITQGDDLFSSAVNTEQRRAGQTLREVEEKARSNPMSVQGNTVNAVRSEQEEWLTKRIASEMGNPNLESLDIPNVNRERRRISDTINRLLKRGDEDASITLVKEDVEEIKQAFEDVPNIANSGTFSRIQNEVMDMLENSSTITGKDLSTVRNTLNAARDRLIGKGSTYEAGLALDQVDSVLNKALRKTMSPDDVAELDEALGQWKLVKAVEGAQRSVGADGTVNVKTLVNTYKRQNPLARKGYDNSPIFNDMQAADFVLDKAGIGNSFTADRLQSGMLRKLAGGAGLVGAGGLLGN